MQGLYAYYNSIDANYNLCIDRIRDEYETRLLNDHSIDKKENEKSMRAAIKYFQEAVEKGEFRTRKNDPEDPAGIARELYENYTGSVKKDYGYFRKNIVSDAEKIFDLYLMLLLLPGHLADFEAKELSQKTVNQKQVSDRGNKVKDTLEDNKVIEKLRNDHELSKRCSNNKISWKKREEIIEGFYDNLVKKNKEYKLYQESDNKDFEADRNFIQYLFRDILFKNDIFGDFMESVDISWFEDSDILKSMILKTIKNLNENDKKIEFSSLSKNWEEDKEFFCKIFDIAVKHDKEYDDIIAQKSKNWDISRIASTDRIILKMAIGEMINFPGIPVKVTINEYIELSKNFSTPKSKKFVNGILDVVSGEFLEKGIIKKSGRGLIDNQ